MNGRKKNIHAISRFFFMLAGVLILLIFVGPLFWTLSTSLKTIPELFSPELVLWPASPQFSNYTWVFDNTSLPRNLKNSAIITFSSVALILLVSAPASFALSRTRFTGKKTWMFLLLVFQMLSPVVIAIPLYRYFMQLGIYNRLWSLVLVYTATFAPFAVWYLKGYFDTIPVVLDEAAKIDGVSHARMFFSIHLPIAGPGIASMSILLLVQCWSQFILPFILLDDKNLFPIPVGLLDLQSTSDAITLHYLAAASVISILPVLLIFAVFQKFIVGALTQGAIKG